MRYVAVVFLALAGMIPSSTGRGETPLSALEMLKSHTDDMLGITWYGDASQQHSSGTYVRLYFGTKAGRVLPLRLKVQYKGYDWLFTKDLLFKIDGRLLRLSPDWHAWEHDNSGDEVWETVDLPASPTLANALANAVSITVRFDGKHAYDDHFLTSEEVAALRRVYWVWRASKNPADKRAQAAVKSCVQLKQAEHEDEVFFQKAERERLRAEYEKESEINRLLETHSSGPAGPPLK